MTKSSVMEFSMHFMNVMSNVITLHFKSNSQRPVNFSPVMNAAERLLVGDVVHQNESHSPAVVGCGDCAVPFLASSVL